MHRTLTLVALLSFACNTEGDLDTDTVDFSIATINPQETPTGVPIDVTVTLDADDPDGLEVAATSSDQAVLADSAITLSGTGSTRTLTLTPGSAGLVVVTVTATDADGASTSTTFEVDTYYNRSAWVGVHQFDTGANEAAQGVDVGPGGHLWVAGYANPDGRYIGYARRYDLAGESQWQSTHDPVLDAQGRDIAVRDDGTAYLATQAKVIDVSNKQFLFLGEIAPTGAAPTEYDLYDAWSDGYGDHTVPGDLDAADDGSLAVAFQGVAGAEGGTDHVAGVRRLQADGSEQFTTTLHAALNTQGWGAAVAAGATRTVVGLTVAGAWGDDTAAGAQDAYLVSLDAEGAEQWHRQLATAADDGIGGIVLDDGGNATICGTTGGSLKEGVDNAGERDLFVARYDASGTQLWLTQIGDTGDDFCADVTLGRNGEAYIAGGWTADGTQHALVAAFDNSGTKLWSTTFGSDGSLDQAFGIAHSGRDLLVAGRTNGTFPNQTALDDDLDSFVARLSEDGTLK